MCVAVPGYDGPSGEDHTADSSKTASSKKRRVSKSVSDGAVGALASGRREIVGAMDSSEAREDSRHRELVDMNMQKHQDVMALETRRIETVAELGHGYIGALMNIGNALRDIGSAMHRYLK